MLQKYNIDVLVKNGSPLEYMSLNIDMFRVFGFWPKKTQKYPRSRLRLLLGWPLLIVVLYVTFFVTELIDVYLIWGDIQSVTENLCVAFTMVNMTFKIAHFVCRNQRIEQLVEDLQVHSSTLDSVDKENQKQILRGCVKHTQCLTLAGNALVVLTALIWGLMNYCFGSGDGVRKLPMRAWYPFDASVTPYYEIASAFQIITLCFMPYTYISFTLFYVVLIIHANGNLTVLRDLLINTRERASRRIGKPLEKTTSYPKEVENITQISLRLSPSNPSLQQTKDQGATGGVSFIEVGSSAVISVGNEIATSTWMAQTERAPLTSSKSRQQVTIRNVQKENNDNDFNIEAHRCLREVVMLHQSILQFTNDLDGVFRPILTIQLIFSLLIIGQVGFQAIALSNQAEGLMKFASYFGCALTELLLYCWYTEQLNHQARLVADSAYSCDWFTSTPSFKRSLQIVMLRSQRPEVSPGRTTMTMSCHTCTLILKNSYSLFALLKQLGET